MRIYYLSDPRTKDIRYVGITKLRLSVRLGNHIRHARAGEATRKGNWLRALLGENVRPLITLIEDNADHAREIYWIKKYREDGHALVNFTDGGQGPKNFSMESRLVLSKKSTGRIKSVGTRLKLSVSLRGHKVSQQTRIKLSMARWGKKSGPMSLEHKNKISAAKMGHEVTRETRLKISAKLKSLPFTRKMVTHCKHGHPYKPDNIFINVRGNRECRACQKVRFARAYAKRLSRAQ